MSDRVFVSHLPNCDFCQQRQERKVVAKYDGKTQQGPWANMCQDHFDVYGVGLGTGKGQRLILKKKV